MDDILAAMALNLEAIVMEETKKTEEKPKEVDEESFAKEIHRISDVSPRLQVNARKDEDDDDLEFLDIE